MLKKERWIIYPLLMLSLFSSLVGAQVIRAQQEVLDRVVSRELVIVNEEGDEVFSVVPKMVECACLRGPRKVTSFLKWRYWPMI